MSEDIIDRLLGLYEQSIKERSHYYIRAVVKEAIEEIQHLRRWKINHHAHELELLEDDVNEG